MKRPLILIAILGLLVLNTRAALYFTSPLGANTTTLNAVIPDNNPNGYVSSIAVGGLGSSLQTLSVNLSVSGGYNGDLYAYLVGPNGQLTVLLNQTGTGGGNTYGYNNTGFNLTLNDGGTAGLHNYQANSPSYNGSGQLTGTWQPDSGGTTFAGQYLNSYPNGTWSLFFADLSQGSQSTLVGWSLDITAVPEPVNVALAVFGGVVMVWSLGRRRINAVPAASSK